MLAERLSNNDRSPKIDENGRLLMIYGLPVLSVLHFCSLTKKRDTLDASYLACTSLLTPANSCLFARVLKRACPIIHGDRKSMINL